MNLFISTGKIISNPRLYRIRQKVCLKMNIVLFKKKKKIGLCSIICVIKDKLVSNLFDILRKNDIVIIEGYIEIKKSSNDNMKVVNVQVKKLHNLRKITDSII